MDVHKIQHEGNIVQTNRVGGAIVNIRDDCFAQNEQEKEHVLAEYHAVGWAIARRIFAEGGTI
ncbi:hypothetical protein WJ0W_000838 [Paenibacillus melissococcoides]|uniref:Uncharacterized protein n=1 Tax=Paenibacillus melissococcoides TaxID=2912268 RepID=A0ABM9FWP4_9BACL|nr:MULTISPECIES: hypothetical protein [Paenibacillus]MEB9897609.1 hypothetical protein [Bacillus cereus]CAH8243599.1 hypothetical protein WJ0W_000838 [Paenibacillus melissococcoides]CAH8704983.1 hypothetical protein WDD9_000823 [Paenibacillus melissococcoides]CAH8708210.1 hypothetical protein HTL2_001909 [Paenibacillus melissococcoides]GIO83022.1 hypothetical protein J6TS7_66320 [Paenibacillus dendritiformis]